MTVPGALLIIGTGLLAAAATLAGGAIALRLKSSLALLTAFSGGVVVSVALLDLLPEAFELSKGAASAFSLLTKVACGFAAYLIIDRLSSLLSQQHSEQRGNLAPALLTLHSGMDGLAIGLALHVSSAAGLIVTVGVLAHDFVDGANSVILSMAHGGTTKRARGWLIANAVAPSLGLAIAAFTTVSINSLAGSLAVFAGGFLFIGASELMPRSRSEGTPIKSAIATLLGFAFIYLIVSQL